MRDRLVFPRIHITNTSTDAVEKRAHKTSSVSFSLSSTEPTQVPEGTCLVPAKDEAGVLR